MKIERRSLEISILNFLSFSLLLWDDYFPLFEIKSRRMNHKAYFFCSIFLMLLFSNCTNDGAATTEAAKNICNCTQTLVQLNEQMEGLKRDGKIEELTQLMGEAGKAFEETIKCAQKNDLKNIDKTNLEEALIETCDMNEQMAKSLVAKL